MNGTNPILRRLRSMRRARHVAAVLVRYGFQDLAHETGLHRLLDRGRELLGRERAEVEAVPAPVRIRRMLEELGPTFVKIGQILSTRADLVPAELARELRQLQSKVPPVPWEEILAVLAAEFPDGWEKVFRSVEPEAIAAGSMAQVHRAELGDGTRVVLKVLRPGIRELIDADMEITAAVAELARGYFENLGFDPVAVTAEFARELRREADLAIEGRSTERMARDFEHDEGIVFPRVHWEASTSVVLALEEIEGQVLADTDPSQLPAETRRRIVARAADAVFRQCLVIGFFHADPHPGNIVVLEGARLAFLDCGMTGHIDPSTAELLASLVHAVIAGDLDRAAKTAVHLASADPALLSDRVFRADVWRYMSRFQVDSLEEIEIGPLLTGFFDLLREYHVQCPADLVYLIKALATIEGVARDLAPDFDLVSHVRPYVEQLVKQRYGLPALRRRFESALAGYTELVEELPGDLRDVFTAIRQKRLSLTVEHRGLERVTASIDAASMNVSYALLVGSLIMGSSVMLLADSIGGEGTGWIGHLAVIGFVSAGLIAVMRLATLFVARRRRR